MNRYLQRLQKRTGDTSRSSKALFQFASVLRNVWLIAGVSLLVALLGIGYALTVTPMYEANLLLQIKRNAPTSGEFQIDVPAATEVEILRSRSILSRVVSSLQLDTTITPKLFPVIGAFVSERNPTLSDPGLFGQGGYVWGAEKLRVALFDVPDPLLRKPFVLTVTGHDGFTISQPESGVLVTGHVAQKTRSRTRFGMVEVLVTQMHARPGAQFNIGRSATVQVVEQLQRSLAISERGKQSNVIGVSLRGSDPRQVSLILNAVGKEYIQQQAAQKAVEAKSQLQFYDQQVDESRQRLQKLDARLNQVLRLHGTPDLSEEATMLAQKSVALEATLAEREQRRVELSTRFADQHPEVITMQRSIRNLHRDLDEVEAKRKVIAAAQQEIVAVNRDKQINNEMNIALLNARHKLDALALSSNVNVRLIDRAEVPSQPVTLGRSTMMVMACLFGLLCGVMASMLKNYALGTHNGARDFENVRRLMTGTGLPANENNGVEQK